MQPIGDRELEKVHRLQNEMKLSAYLTGFFEGILASQELEDSEIGPLLQQCAEFADRYNCPDSLDIIEDFKADLLEFDVISDMVAQRRRALDLDNPKNKMNRFLGLCAGISCDDFINIREVEEIILNLDGADDLLDNPHIEALQTICVDAIADGIVDHQEAIEIAGAISSIVGDCYADTGISAINSSPAIRAEELLTSAS